MKYVDILSKEHDDQNTSSYFAAHSESETRPPHPEFGIHRACPYTGNNEFEDNPTGVLLPDNIGRYFHCTMLDEAICTVTFPQYTSR